MADDDEDDYLNMTFEEAPAKKETSLQRTARLKKEALERGKVRSKAERVEEENRKLETALATEIDSSSKGAKMMAKMGFKGGALGKTEGARTRPIEVQVKEDRGGIGMENDRKRKLREAAEAMDVKEKKVKLTAEEYRERNRQEVEQKRGEGQMWSAMRTLEGFETDGSAPTEEAGASGKGANGKPSTAAKMPLQSINVLWRPLVKQRLEKERDRRMRFDLDQSLSRHLDYTQNDDDEDLAYGDEVEEELDEEDTELQEFEALPVTERLQKVLTYLREKYHYCFWCKYRYADEKAIEDCPGLTEDEHG
ncbi:putative G patch domain-containing protein [Septoria linicola]|nr:putative G patch domain-containing protein [Septoria linicola]